MEDDFVQKNIDDFERPERTKKNFSSDAHFYSYMKKLNNVDNMKNIRIKKNASTINNSDLTQSRTNESVPKEDSDLMRSRKKIQTNIFSKETSTKNLNAELSQSKNVNLDQYSFTNPTQDFWNDIANKKQNDLQDTNNKIIIDLPQIEKNQGIIKNVKSMEFDTKYSPTSTLFEKTQNYPLKYDEKPLILGEIEKRLETINDANFLKGIISEKERENERVILENASLNLIKSKLEKGLLAQNEIINGLKKNEQNLKNQNEKKIAPNKINSKKIIRQKCPNSNTSAEHFLSWNSNKKTHTNCSKCNFFKSCRWICKFCEDSFCIGCIPDCIFEGKCYLNHQLTEEVLGVNRECDHCGNSYENCLYWTDNECALDLCKDCFIELEKTTTGNYVVESNDEIKSLFLIEYNDIMLQKIEKKQEKRNMNCIESNSYMFLTVFLMMFVPFFFFFFGKLVKLIFPFRMNFWKKNEANNEDDSISEDQNQLLNPLQEKTCFDHYKRNFSKDYILFILKLFFVLICFTLLIIPSCLVIVIQIWCLMRFESVESIIVVFDNFFVLKYLIIWIFILMICQEASKTINAIYFVAVKFKTDGCLKVLTLIISLSPLISFFLICWYLCYFNMITIIDDDNVTDVIQNFAGFFILLEFGKIILQFLKSLHFNDFFSWITSSDLFNISLNIGNSNFKIEKTLVKILNEDDFFMEEIYEELSRKSMIFQ